MTVSRCLALMRLTNHVAKKYLLQNGRHGLEKQITRGAHGVQFAYRKPPPSLPKDKRVADILGAFIWWWITWHLLTDYHELIGPNPFPDPSTWTDEELGIPNEGEE